MKALLLILGLTFSLVTIAADDDSSSAKLGQTDGCSSAKAMENCECIVNGEGSEHDGSDGSSGSTSTGTGTGEQK